MGIKCYNIYENALEVINVFLHISISCLALCDVKENVLYYKLIIFSHIFLATELLSGCMLEILEGYFCSLQKVRWHQRNLTDS